MLIKLHQTGTPKARHQRQHGAHRELALVHGDGPHHRAQHVNRTLVHVGDNARQVVRLQAVHLDHLQQRIGRRVGVAARGVELERSLGGGPTGAQAIGEFGRIGVAGHTGRHALQTFQNLRRTGEAVFGEVGGLQTRRGGMGSVQLLAVGGGAQKLPQARRLRAGRAKGMLHLRGVQAQQMPHGRSRCQRAGRAGGVKYLVVGATQKLAHPNADLVASHRGGQQLLPARPQRLRHGHRGRKHHRGRVKHRAVVHIVLLGHMRGRGIGHGGQIRAGAGAVDDDFAGARLRPHGQGKAGDAVHRARAMACHGGAKPVHQQVFGLVDHGGGDVGKTQVGGKSRELGTGRGHERVLLNQIGLQPSYLNTKQLLINE